MRDLVLLRAEGMGQVSGGASSLSDLRSASVPLRVEGALGRLGLEAYHSLAALP